MSRLILHKGDSIQADYKRLFEESPIPMWIYSSVTLQFLAVNVAAVQYYGYSEEQFLSMSVADIRLPDDTGAPAEVVKMPSLNSFYDSGRRRHLKKNGEIFYAQVYSHAVQFGSRIVRVMLAMDINSKVLIEKKNDELNSIIRNQKDRLDDILASVTEVVWSATADSSDILYINPACLEVFGYTRQECTGNDRVLFGIVHPADKDLAHRAWRVLLATGKASYEYRIVHKDGTIKHIANTAVLKQRAGHADVVNGIAIDVTRLRNTEADLREKARDTETILESITDGFYAVDSNWNFVYLNKEFESIVLRRREDLLGKNIWTNFPYSNDLKFYTEQQRAMSGRTSVHFEEYLPILKKWFTVNAYPSRDGLAVYLRDITEEKKRLMKIQMQHDKLRDIAWIQSHKVRGPLSTILGLTDLFNAEEPGDPANAELIESIRSAANSLDKVIKEIVDKSNPIDGQ